MKKVDFAIFRDPIRDTLGIDQLVRSYSDSRISGSFTPLWNTIRVLIEEPLEIQCLSWDE